MALLKKALHLIGPILFILIFVKFIDMNMLLKTLKTVSPIYLSFSFLSNTLYTLGKIYRLYFLLNKSGIKIKFIYLSKIFSYTALLGLVSNVFVANITNIGVLFIDQKNKMRISNIFIVNMVLDLLMILVIFLTCLAINYNVLHIHINFERIVVIFLVFLCFTAVVVIYFKSKFLFLLRDLLLTIKSFIFQIVIFTTFIFFFYAVTVVNNARAFSIDIPLSFLLMVSTLAHLITLLPISVSGIGTRDLTYIVLLNFVNIPSATALALSSVAYIVIPIFVVTTIYIASLIGSRYENSHNR
jgi:uncharacterized membrane protein YbhN (UPF0104 family)